MEQTLIPEFGVLCDFHAHPTHKAPIEEILEKLQEPGLVGLTVKDIDASGKDILRYEQALDLLPSNSFKEIDKGRLAKLGKGYFARTQEIQVGMHHLLALGWQGDYFPNYENIEDAVREIHARNGIAILNHPFSLIVDQSIRLPKSQEEYEIIRRAYALVDEVEVHNAHNINLVPHFMDMRKSNRMAQELRQNEFQRFKGTVSSDCHRRWEQVKITGICLEENSVSKGMESIKENILRGNFTYCADAAKGPYVSRISFLRGILGDMLALL